MCRVKERTCACVYTCVSACAWPNFHIVFPSFPLEASLSQQNNFLYYRERTQKSHCFNALRPPLFHLFLPSHLFEWSLLFNLFALAVCALSSFLLSCLFYTSKTSLFILHIYFGVFVSSVSASPQHCILKTVLLVMINTSLLCVTAFFFFMCEYGGHWQVHMHARPTDLEWQLITDLLHWRMSPFNCSCLHLSTDLPRSDSPCVPPLWSSSL